MKRLAIITTHPIQYYAPVFKLLTERCKIDVMVFYTQGDNPDSKYDAGFGKIIEWDIPLLTGYKYIFLRNTSKNPGLSSFSGIINPTALKEISAFEPHAILVYGWFNKSHIKILRHFKNKIPVWFRGDSTLLDESKSWKQVLRFLFLKWVYSHVDKAFYVGLASKKYFKKFGLKSSELVFAPHAIDNDRFSEDFSAESKNLRQQLQIKDTDKLILFAGKLEAKKNPTVLLEAVSRLEDEGLHLLFVGNGKLEEKLKLQVEENSLKNVHFLDFQNQLRMPAIYQACDIFCLPSKGPGETWGLAVNEAMAAGKTVLVSDKVGCSLDLVDETNGAVFQAENLNDLMNKIRKLCSIETNLEELGNNSASRILDWSFLKQAEAFEKALNEP